MPNNRSVTTYTASHTYAQTQPDRRSDTQAHISPHTQTPTPRTHTQAHTPRCTGQGPKTVKVDETKDVELTPSTLRAADAATWRLIGRIVGRPRIIREPACCLLSL